MNIPFYIGDAAIEVKTGFFTPAWQFLFDQLLSQMQENLSNQGYYIPGDTTVNIQAIAAPLLAEFIDPLILRKSCVLMFDTDLNRLDVIINGTIYFANLTPA